MKSIAYPSEKGGYSTKEGVNTTDFSIAYPSEKGGYSPPTTISSTYFSIAYPSEVLHPRG